MLQRIKQKKQQILRFLFGSFTATSLMFVFQACYGMPTDPYFEAVINGTVTSATTGEPVQGISVHNSASNSYAVTNADGSFSLPVYVDVNEYSLSFRDDDPDQYGDFADLDTVVARSVFTTGVQIQLHERGDHPEAK